MKERFKMEGESHSLKEECAAIEQELKREINSLQAVNSRLENEKSKLRERYIDIQQKLVLCGNKHLLFAFGGFAIGVVLSIISIIAVYQLTSKDESTDKLQETQQALQQQTKQQFEMFVNTIGGDTFKVRQELTQRFGAIGTPEDTWTTGVRAQLQQEGPQSGAWPLSLFLHYIADGNGLSVGLWGVNLDMANPISKKTNVIQNLVACRSSIRQLFGQSTVYTPLFDPGDFFRKS